MVNWDQFKDAVSLACYLSAAAKGIKELVFNTPGVLSLISPETYSFIIQKRIECLVSTLRLTQQKLSDANLSDEELRYCSLKLGVPIVENSSLEDEPILQDLWANLLANAFNPNYKDEIRVIFVDIIKNISSSDAKVLNAFAINPENPLRYHSEDTIKLSAGSDYEIINAKTLSESISVLSSLALISDIGMSASTALECTRVLTQTGYYITDLGHSFINACIKDAGKCCNSTSKVAKKIVILNKTTIKQNIT